MADPLYELLIPFLNVQDASSRSPPLDPQDPITSPYLNRLSTLTLSALTTTEPQSLTQRAHSTLRSLQSLSKKSYKPIISSSSKLDSLGAALPTIRHEAQSIPDALQPVEDAATRFAQKYRRDGAAADDNAVLERRKSALLLSHNVDRVADVLDLPTLLSSAIASSSSSAATAAAAAAATAAPSSAGGGAAAATASSAAAANTNYASALDLHAHIKRLHATYPQLALVGDIAAQAEHEMKGMTSNLVASLQASQGLKLAGAMRTIGWLRRVAPELDDSYYGQGLGHRLVGQRGVNLVGSGEGALGALFLVCRLVNLMAMLEALDPLRELADQESQWHKGGGQAAASGSGSRKANGAAWAGGQQTERYLKRWIEIFREQSFAIMSMYRSIFPSALPVPGSAGEHDDDDDDADGQKLPSPLATFPMHLVEMLMETLQQYLANVRDRTSRESLLTQVLYCAGSLGRLGADFGARLAMLLEEMEEEEEEEGEGEVGGGYEEWVEVVKKHRVQASRLELLASGVGRAAGVSMKA